MRELERIAEKVADDVMAQVPEGVKKIDSSLIYDALDRYTDEIMDIVAGLVERYLPEDVEVRW